MAITKRTEEDKIEVVGEFKHIQVRTATVIEEDGVEISRSYDRFMLYSGDLDASDNLVDNPLDKEPDEVTAIPDDIKGMCNILWTDSIKAAWKAHLITLKPS